MVIRDLYLRKIVPYINKPIIKVIKGMRRVGKSVFLKQIINYLLTEKKINKNNIIYINKELIEYDFIKNYQHLYKYIKDQKANKNIHYVFVDEVQEIIGWEKAINSLLAEGKYDIYVTGSNAKLLSSELTTLIGGRYIDINIYPLGFEEFLKMRKNKGKNIEKEFLHYLKWGGLPGLHVFKSDEISVYQYITSVYNTILLKEIIERKNIRRTVLLESVVSFLAQNIGNIFSAKSISDYLKSQKIKVASETIQHYIKYIQNSYILYELKRFDLKGKRIFEIYNKYYLADHGILNGLLGYNDIKLPGLLENIVYMELLRQDYKVYLGQFNRYEIDFVAEKNRKRIYIQVCYLLNNDSTIEREFGNLLKIPDNYPKYVISLDKYFNTEFKGIQRKNIIDFLQKSKQWGRGMSL